MNYPALVDEYIKKSGLSLAEITKRMHELKGIKIDRSYISKLRKDPKYPASEEINRALAEITGGDVEALVMAGYLEKAPEKIKESINKASLLEKLFSYLLAKHPLQVEVIGENENSDNDEAIEYFNSPEFLLSLNEEELKQILGDLLENMSENDPKDFQSFIYSLNDDKNSYVKERSSIYSTDNMRRVPVLGQIAAGIPIDRQEYCEGYTLVDPATLHGKEAFALRVKGDSMIGDRIYDGDLVIVTRQDEVFSSDIAVVAVNGDFATLKRVKYYDDKCMLIPSNPSMEPQLIPAKDVKIIGKVVEVKFWPK
ncbi:hypothetical protein BVG16_13370 [Paenibacillus selenitireducens]|uniref:Peptidase S24/S26A/S26B/S26C domain-containing protein n=1 Tax=Paenibacillus selenitireducens TaxID=1324314 RepID=A0A1T2XCV6_9BACL|nr:S24 family peptidase [Paenibacillus selenitireducens]OPA77443.1 hypothetical protein BVG16_13370 [Paenibacillus selenitireducens]